MHLTEEQQAMFDGANGPELQLALKTLVRYGAAFGAARLVPIKSSHLAGTFAISGLKSYRELLGRLVKAGITVKVPTTVNPRPGCTFSKVNRWLAFPKQDRLEAHLARLGVIPNYSCVCYHDARGPAFGDILGWSESSAVIYANSVIGARTNRNSIMVDICMAVTGWTPEFGLLCDENRKGSILVKLDIDRMDAAALGFILGRVALNHVPVLMNHPFTKWELKNMGAAMAASGGIALFHVLGLTPEAPNLEAVFDKEPREHLLISQKEIDSVRSAQQVQDAAETLVLGCPQMTLEELQQIAPAFSGKKFKRRVIFHVVPSHFEQFKQTPEYQRLVDAGAEFQTHCPLAALSLRSGKQLRGLLSNSGKLHYYLEGCAYGNLQDLTLEAREDL